MFAALVSPLRIACFVGVTCIGVTLAQEPAPAPAPVPDPKPAAPAAPEKKAEPKPEEPKKDKKTVAEVTKDHKALGGLFTIYVDEAKGSMLLRVNKNQLNQEYIYFTQALDGLVRAGYNRGQFGSESVIVFRKVWDKIQIVEQPTGLYFEPGHPLERAAKANTSEAMLASETILAEDDQGFVIPASGLFLKETMLAVKQPGGSSNAVLGRLSDSKTHLMRAQTFPENVLVQVAYVYENASPSWAEKAGAMDDLADPRYVTIEMQHALIAMPKNTFRSRRDDSRLGFFTTRVTDMTSPSVTPYRDVIHRWHLQKRKPGTPLSEPVEPLVFWIENTTPVEFRDTIRTAALKWNVAFETAGFKDALVIKQQPDDADWSADDIRYNVLRWTSSPQPPFGGYGPSFVNPRTGQILGADVMLEFSYVTNRLRSSRLYEEIGLAGQEASATEGPRGVHDCAAGLCVHQGLLFARAALKLRAAPSRVETNRAVKEALHYLVLHELGHTLGLNHNFKGSGLWSPEELHDRKKTSRLGLYGSVMDYPTANVAPAGTPQGEYYTTAAGPYDHWAIEYGYSEALEDPVAEAERLEAIAARSHERELAFANDADDMRATGRGIDPRAMLFDLSSDPIRHGSQRCEIARERLAHLVDKPPTDGQSWQEVVQDFVVLTSDISNALLAISRQVGGVHVERVYADQPQGQVPLRPVAREQQLAALQALIAHGFSAKAWETPPTVLAHLQRQRRGFDFRDDNEDPHLHDRIERIQRALLDHLLHPNTLKRLTDSAMYGDAPTVSEVLSVLSTGVLDGDPEPGPSSVRQALQALYVAWLLQLTQDARTPVPAQSAALYQLLVLRQKLDAGLYAGQPEHRALLQYRIRRGLDLDGTGR
ncbi:MAG: zinc-dependent metalloprotease [Verrucomicrobiales bacterium]|nr:zinc-dependent metalloprotease [Verrucomicrobiales bacterium]